MDSGASRDSGASWGANASWDTPADPGITSANGNHPAKHASRGPFDAAFTVSPDPGERTEPAQDQGFSWLDNSQPESRPAEPADRGYAWPERADASLAARPEAEPAPEPAGTERIPRHQADGLTSPERTDFWARPAPQERTDFWAKPSASPSAPGPVPTDLQPPVPTPRAEEPTITPASWPASADTTTTSAAEPAQRAATDVAGGAAATAQPLSSAGSAVQTTGSQREDRRRDRSFPVRLLAVIVIAALIGSALVLLLR
jgi:hypothetical protein